MKLAVHQSCGVPGDPAANLSATRDGAADAAAAGAELLVLPELWLTGYNIGDSVRALAEPADGPSAGAIAEIARGAGLAILYGFPESDGADLFNAAQLIDATGCRRACYRKAQLYGPEETRLYAPGNAAAPLVRLGGLTVAVLVCYDVEFPEAVRRAALEGAEAVLVPTALFQPHEFVARQLIPVRAFENGLFLAYANRCGREGDLTYVGRSSICGPDGAVLTAADDRPALLTAELDPAAIPAARRVSPYLQDRRPDLYRA